MLTWYSRKVVGERKRGLQFVIVIMVIGHKETVLIMPYLNSELP